MESRRVLFRSCRQTHAPIETRGCLAVWDEGRQHLTMHVGTQVPHPYRTQLAARLGLSESQVTVISPDIGGAFGQKIALYREEWVVAALARRLRRPVRWRKYRMEKLMAARPAREDWVRTRATVDLNGRNHENGRAPSRETECQNGSVTGVAVESTKQHDNLYTR